MLDLMTRLVEAIGAPAIGLLMLLENVFPPIPSEVIMTAAGYHAATGRLDLLAVIFWGTLGSVLGATFWFWVGRAIGTERLQRLAARHGRWLTLSPADVAATERWFLRYGWVAVFLGRLVPAVRTLISVPAGMARMRLGPFLAYTAAGSLVWTSFLALAGWFLGEAFGEIDTWLNPVSNLVIFTIICVYLYRVVTWKARSE